MLQNDTKRNAETASVKREGSGNNSKDKRTNSKSGGGASKSGIKGKGTLFSESGPAFIDYTLVSDLDVKLVAQPLESSRLQDPYLRQPSDFLSPGEGKPAPRSASSAESSAEVYDSRGKVFSVSSSFSTNMSDPPEYGSASETLSPAQTSDFTPDLSLHDSGDFFPGTVVKLEVFEEDSADEEAAGSKKKRRKRKRLTHAEFLKLESARRQKIGLFAIFRTYADYSMAIRIHTYDPKKRKERNRLPEYQAIIYTGAQDSLIKDGDKPPANPAIQVAGDGSQELPKGSRLDYSDTFIVQHQECVAFVGRITDSCFPNFASSYHRVQQMLGNNVLLPTSQPMTSASAPLEGPSSPDHHTSEMTSTSNTGRFLTEQNAAGDAGWAGYYGSEAPIHQLRHLGLGGTTAETNKQDRYSPGSTGFGLGYGGMGAGNLGGQMSRPVEAYASEAERNEIAAPQKWIDDATHQRNRMMRLVVQPNQTVEALCNLRGVSRDRYVASRVRVAILDTEIDIDSPIFSLYQERIKDYKDFRTESRRARSDSHGTHVTSLFLHMAPEADVYIAQAFDTWESFTDAIIHALDVWKVDVISISGGGRTKYHKRMAEALRQAYRIQVPVFAATHNEGLNKPASYPATHETVFPVFATSNCGKPSYFAPDPLPGRSFGTLGENITPFWMGPKYRGTIGGSSFATPIAAGSFASTLLFARLLYNEVRKEPHAELLGENEVMNELMDMLAPPPGSARKSFGYVNPSNLWQKGTLVKQIKLMVEQVEAGELSR